MQPLLKPPSLSLIVPIYRNAGGIERLLAAVEGIANSIDGDFDAVFVVDGSPDASYAELYEQLPRQRFRSTLVSLSRNFGAFPAIRVGIEIARGDVMAVMAADLQEPPELIVSFWRLYASESYDVAFGIREGRQDPWSSRMASGVFWSVYRRMVMRDIPEGGVDIFALSAAFKTRLLQLNESHSSLLGQLFWLGGRRAFVRYERRKRELGKSAWTLRKKLRYLSDSVFAFTDLPVRMLTGLGVAGIAITMLLGVVTIAAKFTGAVVVPGYAGTMLTILFFGALNSLGLGIVGTYAWHAFENTKSRPLAVIQTSEVFNSEGP